MREKSRNFTTAPTAQVTHLAPTHIGQLRHLTFLCCRYAPTAPDSSLSLFFFFLCLCLSASLPLSPSRNYLVILPLPLPLPLLYARYHTTVDVSYASTLAIRSSSSHPALSTASSAISAAVASQSLRACGVQWKQAPHGDYEKNSNNHVGPHQSTAPQESLRREQVAICEVPHRQSDSVAAMDARDLGAGQGDEPPALREHRLQCLPLVVSAASPRHLELVLSKLRRTAAT